MTDQEVAPEEATEEVVDASEDVTESVEEEPTDDDQQPESEADGGEETPEEEQTESQKRRERRKVKQAELYKQTEEAKARKERQMAVWDGGVEPKESDYEDPTEYAIDAALYRQRQAGRQHAEQQADAEISELTAQQQVERTQFWQEQVADAKGRYQDFDQVALGRHWSPTDTMAEVIQTSDQGADVAYFLGSNAHIAQQIASLPPALQARELGKLEATLSMPKPKTETSAPEPIKPVKPSSNPRRGLEGLSQSDYRAARMKEISSG